MAGVSRRDYDELARLADALADAAEACVGKNITRPEVYEGWDEGMAKLARALAAYRAARGK